MPTITPISAFLDAEQSGTDTSFVQVLATSALDPDTDYLVLYSGSVGTNTGAASRRGRLQLRQASGDVLADVQRHRSPTTAGDPGVFQNAPNCCGFTILRAADNNGGVLEFNAQCASGDGSTNEWYTGALAIIAIPLTGFTDGTDYWENTTNADTQQLVDASESAFETVLEDSFTIPATGDYLVLFACEGSTSSNSSTRAMRMRFEVDASDAAGVDAGGGEGFQVQGHTVSSEHFYGWAFARLLTLGAGVHTFRIAGASRTGATADFRRGRIVILSADAFGPMQANTTTTAQSTSSGTYATGSLPSLAINPIGDYVLIGSSGLQNSTDGAIPSMRLRDVTNAASAREGMGAELVDTGYDTDSDLNPCCMVHASSVSGAHTWEMQHALAVTGGTMRSAVDAAGGDGLAELIFWDLGEIVTETTPDPVVVTPALPSPNLIHPLVLDPVVIAATVPVPGRVPAQLTISLITSFVSNPLVNAVEALIEDRGHVVTQRAASSVVSGDLANDHVVVTLLESSAHVANALAAINTAGVPVVCCSPFQTEPFGNTRGTAYLVHELGLVANTQAITLASFVLAAGTQDLPPLRGYPLGYVPELLSVATGVYGTPTAETEVAGRALVTDSQGRIFATAADVGEARVISVGGTLSFRSAFAGYVIGSSLVKDGSVVLGVLVEWAAGLYEALPYPRI